MNLDHRMEDLVYFLKMEGWKKEKKFLRARGTSALSTKNSKKMKKM